MRIRMLKTSAGPDGSFQEGKTYEVDGEVAGPLIQAGSAERVDPVKVEAAVIEEEVETAVVDDEPAEPEPVEWDLKMSPEAYLERYPDGPNAEAARAAIGG